MKTTKATIFALAILMPMLILAFAVAPAQAKSPDCKIVDTNQVACNDVQVNDWSYLDINGHYHINMLVSHCEDSLDVKLHFDWHGTIVWMTECGYQILSIDTKNIQLLVHASASWCGECQMDAWVNFHTNTVVTIGDGQCIQPIDLKVHIIMSFDDGNFNWIKVQLPNFCDAPII